MADIHRLLYGRVHLSDLYHQVTVMKKALNKLMKMRADLDYCFQEITMLVEYKHKLVTVEQFSTLFDSCINDKLIQQDDRMRKLANEVQMRVESGLKRLDNLPKTGQYVSKVDFRYMEDLVFSQGQKIEQISTTLLNGFQTEFEHLLKSRPSITEIEDLMALKFDKVLGTELQGKIDMADAKIQSMEEVMGRFDEKILE